MADIVHVRDDHSISAPGRPAPARADAAERGARPRQDGPPRTDLGTILLHWITAITFIISLLTGLRMATFGHVAPRFAQWLSPILPQGEMWTWHFFASLGLF